MLTRLSRLVGLDQPPARTGQRGADRAAREPRLSGDSFVRNTRVPQQQYLPVARRELFQRGADAGALVLDVERVVRSGLARLRLGRAQREVATLPRGPPGVVPRPVRRPDEGPPPRLSGRVHHGPTEPPPGPP